MDDRVVLVTGGGSGIGSAIGRRFAANGSRVVVSDIRPDAAAAIAREISASGGKALAIAADVADSGSVGAMVQAAIDEFGHLDVVCANAGIAVPDRPLSETTEETIDALLGVNLKGAILTLRAAIPHLRDGGCAVITSSISGLWAHSGGSVYSASKMGLIGFARSLALELAPRGIRVNVVCPGGVDTPMLSALHEDMNEVKAEYAAINPLGRLAQPEEVADAVAFLASSEARHITGVALRVDGGDCLTVAL